MSEKPIRSIREEIETAAAKARERPPYLRTQSSAARTERAIRRLGYDPRYGHPVQEIDEDVSSVNVEPETLSVEAMRTRKEHLDQFRLQRP